MQKRRKKKKKKKKKTTPFTKPTPLVFLLAFAFLLLP